MTATTKQLITGLYVAFYNRAPDKAGLAHWQQRAAAGNEASVFSEIAADFAVHPKFSELYGHLDNQQFVEAIYRNVLGHAGDNPGISYWTGKIESATPRSDMVVDFIYSALNFDASDEEWNTLTTAEKAIAQNRHDTLVNKTTAALAFVDTYGDATNITSPADLDNDPAYLASIVALSNIDETPASIDVAAARLSLRGDVIVIDASTEADTTAPFFITSSTASAIDENSGAGQVIYKAHAEDTGTITYHLKPGGDSALLSIDNVTGEVSLTANPDYESKSGYSFTVIATDENGNSSEKAVSLAINNLTDTTPLSPADTAAPTATLLYSTDGGSTYSTTLMAKDADTLRIKATFNEAINDGPGATIAIDNSVLTATAMVKITTTEYYYDLDVPAGDLATATVTIGAAEDNANNVITAAPTNATFSIDNTPPATTITGIDISADTGTSATDFTTQATAQTITATLSTTLATGEILYGSVDNGATWTDVTAKTTGTAISWNGASLSGNSAIAFKVSDAAGNDGPTATQAYVLDTAAPTANLAAATDNVGSVTGALSAGDTTDDTALVLSGTNEAGATVQVYNGATLLGAASVSGTSWNYSAAVANGVTYQFNVKETDAAGNTSAASSNFEVTGDTTAPTANLTAATDNVGSVTGSLSTGDTTDDTALVLSGTNEAGASVQVYNGATLLGAASVSGTSWNYTATVANGVTYQFNVKETDAAGNTSAASSNFAVTGDTTAPTATISGASYNATTDTLTFTGSNMASLLSGAETAATDLTANFDWTKLQWDVDSDDTGNITFTEADIASAKATDGTTLEIAFTTAKAAALEATAGFDPLDTDDTVEVAAGFTRDVAGNAASTDKFIGPTDTSVVVFDLVGGTSSDHSGRTFQAGTSYTIYIRVDSNTATLATDANSGTGSWGTWATASALASDDVIVLVGTNTPILGALGSPVTDQVPASATHGWISVATAAWVVNSGVFGRRAPAQQSSVTIWSSNWSSNPNAGHTLNQIYAVGIPAGVLTSQGLA